MNASERLPRLVLVVLTALLAGCAGPDPRGRVDLDAPPRGRWVPCPGGGTPAATAQIGPAGDTLPHPQGHSLTVPSGALSQTRTFTIIEPQSPQFVVRVNVAPPNVSFTPPATLRLNIGRCPDVPPVDSLRVVRMEDDGSDPEEVPFSMPEPDIISVVVDNLSLYGLATN